MRNPADESILIRNHADMSFRVPYMLTNPYPDRHHADESIRIHNPANKIILISHPADLPIRIRHHDDELSGSKPEDDPKILSFLKLVDLSSVSRTSLSRDLVKSSMVRSDTNQGRSFRRKRTCRTDFYCVYHNLDKH